MQHPTTTKDSAAWIFFVWAAFIISAGLMMLGILYMPVDFWIKGYLFIGSWFLISATFTLAKTIRDNTEAQKLINRVVDAKTEKIISEYELRAS